MGRNEGEVTPLVICHMVHVPQLFCNTSSFKWSIRVSMLPLSDLGNPWSNSLGITAIFKSYIWAIHWAGKVKEIQTLLALLTLRWWLLFWFGAEWIVPQRDFRVPYMTLLPVCEVLQHSKIGSNYLTVINYNYKPETASTTHTALKHLSFLASTPEKEKWEGGWDKRRLLIDLGA